MKVLKNLKEKIIKNKKYILGIITGILISGTTVYAATIISAVNVSYSNTSSKLSSTNVQDAIDELYTKAKTNCPDGNVCETKLSFSSDSWATIAKNVKAGNGWLYKVGDTKTISMGSFGTHTLRLANTTGCTNGETSDSGCGFIVEFADIITKDAMNSTDTNSGGWPASDMRTYINGTIYNALPSDLKSVIVSSKIVSSHGTKTEALTYNSTDKLFLLSSKEVFGGELSSGTNIIRPSGSETKQLDYYKKYENYIKKYNNKDSDWWLRSADDTEYFYLVLDYGHEDFDNAGYDYGISPAFKIA